MGNPDHYHCDAIRFHFWKFGWNQVVPMLYVVKQIVCYVFYLHGRKVVCIEMFFHSVTANPNPSS